MQPPSKTHCVNNGEDRRLGERWERNFCLLAADAGKGFTPLQIGRPAAANWYKRPAKQTWHSSLLPDVAVWTAPGEHHEIKHKNPTRGHYYGLEKYRLDALVDFRLETQQPVMYTIHDWELAGARSSRDPMPNRLEHWRTIDVLALEAYISAHVLFPVMMDTWVNGRVEKRLGYYWPVTLWQTLETWWRQLILPSFR